MSFSDRNKITPGRGPLSPSDMPASLRNRLWNSLCQVLELKSDAYSWEPPLGDFVIRDSLLQGAALCLFENLWHKPADELPGPRDTYRLIKSKFSSAKWHECYDIIEWMLCFAANQRIDLYDQLSSSLNHAFATELAAWRVFEIHVVPVTDPAEIESIETALQPDCPASRHINEAVRLLSDRHTIDYRNCIKEAVSAVEAQCRECDPSCNLDFRGALARLEQSHKLHPALKSALSKLYGFASDAQGIRHSLKSADTPVDAATAKLLLVVCSALVNHIRTKLQQ